MTEHKVTLEVTKPLCDTFFNVDTLEVSFFYLLVDTKKDIFLSICSSE